MLRISQVLIALLLAAIIVTSVPADPPDNYIAKFVQKPLIELNFTDPINPDPDRTYYGHDEESTAHFLGWYSSPDGMEARYSGTFMADDFADKIDQSVVHVQWWGSYLSGTPQLDQGVKRFLISFESDIPASDTGDFSRPGEVLSSQIVTLNTTGTTPSPGNFTERAIHPGGPPLSEELFVYNAELANPFPQKKDTVYWLKIVALDDSTEPGQENFVWGWHNRDYTIEDTLASRPPEVYPGEYIQPGPPIIDFDGNQVPVWHFQDDAVTGAVDIAFVSGPIPEETTIRVTQDTLNETYYIPGIDMPYDIPELSYSKDLAFALYTVPEPSAFILLGLSAVCLFGAGRRGRK